MTEAEQIEAAKAAISKATSGPWKYCGCNRCQLVWGDGLLVHDQSNGGDEAPTPANQEGINNAILIAAAPALVRRVQELEDWQAKALPWLEKVRDSLAPLKNGDYLDDSEGIQYELDQIKKLEALIAQGGRG